MEIRYSNINGKPLTPEQIVSSKIYKKILEENSRLRRVEYYEDNIITDTFYYIEFGTSHQDLLALDQDVIKIIEIEDVDLNYIRHRSFKYYNGLLESKGIEICNSDGYWIITQDLDMQTNLPIYNKTYKYYTDSINGYEFEFSYYSSGELASVVVSNVAINFYEQYKFSELDLIPHFEWWPQYSSYYLNAEPAVPDNMIIT